MRAEINGHPIADAPALAEGQWAELVATPPPGATLSLAVAGVTLEPFLRPGDPAWRWRWLAPAAAGSYALRLCAVWPAGRAEELRATLAVVPRKLDAERYAAMLTDLQRLGRALVFALCGGAAAVAAPAEPDTTPATPTEELHTLFGSALETLAAAVERLARRPPDRLHSTTATVALGRLQDSSRVVAVRPEHDEALVTTPVSSYDSYEARLLRRLLDSLWRRLERMVTRQSLPPALLARAEHARERLRDLRALPFLAGVPPLTDYRGPTPRMQRDPDYRAVYRVWQLLRRRPLLTWDEATLHIPVADLPRLYERWCAACVALALLEVPGYTLSAQTMLVDGDDEQLLALPDEVPLVTLAGPDGVGLALRYHPRYRPGAQSAPLQSLDRHTRIPDLVIELTRPDATPTVVVLDAKYRLDASGGVPESALADAYSYLGAIGTPGGGRASVAAALLYPGHGPAEVYASGVAALPLLPGNESALRAWLAGLVAQGWRA